LTRVGPSIYTGTFGDQYGTALVSFRHGKHPGDLNSTKIRERHSAIGRKRRDAIFCPKEYYPNRGGLAVSPVPIASRWPPSACLSHQYIQVSSQRPNHPARLFRRAGSVPTRHSPSRVEPCESTSELKRCPSSDATRLRETEMVSDGPVLRQRQAASPRHMTKVRNFGLDIHRVA